MDKIRRWNIKDIDDMRGAAGFQVDKTRKRPDSTYLDLNQAVAQKPANGKLHDWRFETGPAGEPEVKGLSIAYSPTYRVGWEWQEAKGVYARLINDRPHLDRETGEPILAANVIVQSARHRDLNDKEQHIDVEVVGSGESLYFLAGRVVSGTWSKESREAPTLYLDADRSPVRPAPGQTWVEVVRPPTKVERY